MVCAPFASNCHVSLGIKVGGWDVCREVRDALIAGIEHHRLLVRVELSPRRKIALSNMFKAEAFFKNMGANAEPHMLCLRSSKILSKSSNEDLGETSKGSNAWTWHREHCSNCGLTLTGWEDFAN